MVWRPEKLNHSKKCGKVILLLLLFSPAVRMSNTRQKDYRLPMNLYQSWLLFMSFGLLVTGQWERDWNNAKMQQSKLFPPYNASIGFTWHAPGVLCGVECLSRLCSVSREWQHADLDRQVETETMEGIETQLGTQSCMSKSTHARAMWTCTHSHMAHTTRKWHTQGSDSDVAHVHIFTSHEVEPVSWCRAVLNFKGHLRHSNQSSHTGMDSHTHAHEWIVDFTPLP